METCICYWLGKEGKYRSATLAVGSRGGGARASAGRGSGLTWERLDPAGCLGNPHLTKFKVKQKKRKVPVCKPVDMLQNINTAFPFLHFWSCYYCFSARFGVGVKSYFVFLRYLIYLNLLHSVLVGGFILGPTAFYGRNSSGEIDIMI